MTMTPATQQAYDMTNRAQEITPDLFGRFVSFLDAAPATVRTYTASLRDFARYLAAHEIRRPQRADVIAYRDTLKEKLKPATVQLRVTAVRLFFQWTATENLYPDIAAHIKGPRIDKLHKKDALDLDQVKEILATIDTDTARGCRDAAIILLMVTGGLRDIEVHRANVEDLIQTGSSWRLLLQGKGKADRAEYVKVVPKVVQILRRYLDTRQGLEPGAPLFASMSNNSRARRLSVRSISGLVKDHMKRAGYDSRRISAHSLRHAAVTEALKGGATLQEVQQFARHRNIETTLIYAHNLDQEANKCADIISSGLFNDQNRPEILDSLERRTGKWK